MGNSPLQDYFTPEAAALHFSNNNDGFASDLGSPRASEILEPVNHRFQWREAEGRRGEEAEVKEVV
ncbi:hypothetical protein EYF80_039871 [Liparis tanakae]|uniref:Uncharacterized protein n=1 Tax=Liparis tanakae TaxID=230148 RepID=A0A4Z2GB35_9TELE|nr:hypothetical protein EYF80_039871 [Liparis tanakae]